MKGAEVRVRLFDEVEPRLRSYVAFLRGVDRDSFDLVLSIDPWLTAANERLLEVTSPR